MTCTCVREVKERGALLTTTLNNCLVARSNGREEFLGQETKQDPVSSSSHSAAVLFETEDQRLRRCLPGCSKRSLRPPFLSDLVLLQCRKSSWGFLTCRQLCWAGLGRAACQSHGAGPMGQVRTLKHPCLPQHEGDAVKKASIPQICQCGSLVPCLENRPGGVQCTWVQSRILPLRWAGMRACGSEHPPLPLSFLGEGAAFWGYIEAFGCFVCLAAGRGQARGNRDRGDRGAC